MSFDSLDFEQIKYNDTLISVKNVDNDDNDDEEKEQKFINSLFVSNTHFE